LGPALPAKTDVVLYVSGSKAIGAIYWAGRE